MFKRSFSVSKFKEEDIIKRYPKTFEPVMERKIGRIIKQRFSLCGKKNFKIPLGENCPVLHKHIEKSYEHLVRVSPSVRKFDESSSRLQEMHTGRIVRTISDRVQHRKEKSSEILNQVNRVLCREKENNKGIKRTVKDYNFLVREKIKGINQDLLKHGIPSIKLAKRLHDKKKHSIIKGFM